MESTDPTSQPTLQPEPPKPCRKRLRYTSHACTVCQRRKIKCNGEKPCVTCKASESTCQYTESMQRGRPKGYRINKNRKDNPTVPKKDDPIHPAAESDVSLRLQQLEEEVRSLRQSHGRGSESSEGIRRTSPNSSTSVPEMLARYTITNPIEGGSIAGDLQPDVDSSTIHVAQTDIPGAENARDMMSLPGQCADFQNLGPPLEVSGSPEEGQDGNGEHGLDNMRKGGGDVNNLLCLLRFTNNFDDNINLFFREFGCWFPCIQMEDVWPRLQSLFQASSPQHDGSQIGLEEAPSLSLVALVCTIMAVCEFLKQNGPAASLNQEMAPRWPTHEDWYAESCKLLARRRATQELDVLRQSLLSALYQLMLENFTESSQAIARAVDIAFALDLNDESHWVGFTDQDRLSRRALWWTLYLFDRRVARKIGRPYYIHDRDALVGDFSPDKILGVQTQATNLGIAPSPQEITKGQQCFVSSQSWYSYLQFHVEWSRISTKVWDTLYAVRAPNTGDENHIESLDALVVRLKRNLTLDMIWNTDYLESKACDQAWDHTLRLQLVIFTRINLLRMWIRRNSIAPPQQDKYNACFGVDEAHNADVCRDLASVTVDAVTRFMQFRLYQRPFATFATMSLMECLNHLLSLPSHLINNEELQRVLSSARNCLNRMSMAGLKVAQNSLGLLRDMLDAHEKSQVRTPMPGWLEFPPISRFGQDENPQITGTCENLDVPGGSASDPFTFTWDATNPLEDSLSNLDASHNGDQAWSGSHDFHGAFTE